MSEERKSYSAVDMIARAKMNCMPHVGRRRRDDCTACRYSCGYDDKDMARCQLVQWENAAATFIQLCSNLDVANIHSFDHLVEQGISASTTPSGLADEIRRQRAAQRSASSRHDGWSEG